MMANIASGPRPSDKYIPWYIVGFFVLLTCLLAWFAMLAHGSYTGVVTDNAYKKGLAYNTVINEANKEKSLGWNSKIEVLNPAEQQLNISFVLKDKNAKIIKGAEVEVWLVRPSKSGMDEKFRLSETSPGVYSSDVKVPAKGLWNIVVSATKDGSNYQDSERTVVK